MKRIYDMNYDHWVEACGPESYKSTYDYVDLDMQKKSWIDTLSSRLYVWRYG